MKTMFTRVCKLSIIVILLSFWLTNYAQERGPSDYLIGQWTFEPGNELKDLKGNFSDLVLYGSVSISNGQLDVDNISTYAKAHNYNGPTIEEKTLVSWLYLEDLNIQSGSALTIDRTNTDEFDAIVYGELQTHRWMAGSSYLRRTYNPVPGYEEITTNELVKMAITYQNNGGLTDVKIYRNDILIGEYTKGNIATWSAGYAEIVFGRRHANRGQIDARIEEARIYNGVLTQQEIASLNPYTPPAPSVPLSPWVFVILIVGMFTALFLRYRKTQLS